MEQGPSEMLLVHLYRGEIARSDTWRTRLDTTTNWALTSAAAVISFAFSSPAASHTTVLIGGFLVATFLTVEARRYRYYDLWIRRVRLMEDGILAPKLRGEAPDPDALRDLADLIHRPRLAMSSLDAVGLRIRRTYAPIFLVLLLAWLFKLTEHPRPAGSIAEIVARARIGVLPGPLVLLLVAVGVGVAVGLWVRSFTRPLPSGEMHPRRRTRPMAAIFTRG